MTFMAVVQVQYKYSTSTVQVQYKYSVGCVCARGMHVCVHALDVFHCKHQGQTHVKASLQSLIQVPW